MANALPKIRVTDPHSRDSMLVGVSPASSPQPSPQNEAPAGEEERSVTPVSSMLPPKKPDVHTRADRDTPRSTLQVEWEDLPNQAAPGSRRTRVADTRRQRGRWHAHRPPFAGASTAIEICSRNVLTHCHPANIQAHPDLHLHRRSPEIPLHERRSLIPNPSVHRGRLGWSEGHKRRQSERYHLARPVEEVSRALLHCPVCAHAVSASFAYTHPLILRYSYQT